MKVKFNKDIQHTCSTLKIGKEYEVEKETHLNVWVKDETGEVRPYPTAWVKEWLG